MKAKVLRPISCRRLVVVAASTIGAAILPILPAQVTSTSPANAPKSADVIELSPFTVNETLDRGYAAQETLAGNVLQLPPPADGKEFAKAVLLRSGREAKLGQNEQGLRIEVPRHDAWDPIDTVIKLTVQANTKVTP